MDWDLKEGDEIKIEWVDSESVDQIWHLLTEAKKQGLDKVFVLGYYIGQTEECVTISQGWSEVEDHEPTVSGIFNVPKGCIKNILIVRQWRKVKTKRTS
jgi:hypothetical protein